MVVHVSGNKENSGNIVRVNQGLTKVFEYSKVEIVGHSVNILMPLSFGRRHNEFLEKFFRTGRKTVFNTMRTFYGIKKSGSCFCLNLLVKQMPSLEEGIQYVGMIRAMHSDSEYILTDSKGLIECCSQGIASSLGLPFNVFKENEINIQILAPDLIRVFNPQDVKRGALSKFQEPSGQRLTFIVPKDFTLHTQTDIKKADAKRNSQSKGIGVDFAHRKIKVPAYLDLNKAFNKGNRTIVNQITSQKLLQSHEYREYEIKQTVKCEIIDCIYGDEYKDMEPLKVRVFKIKSGNAKRTGLGGILSSDASEPFIDSHSTPSNSENPKSKSNNLTPRKEEKQEFLTMIIRKSDIESITPTAKEDVSNREETKLTEKLPGNLITTEQHEAKAEPLDDPLDDAGKDESTPRMNIGTVKAPELEPGSSQVAERSSLESASAKSSERRRKNSPTPRKLSASPCTHKLIDQSNKAGTMIEDRPGLRPKQATLKQQDRVPQKASKHGSLGGFAPFSNAGNELEGQGFDSCKPDKRNKKAHSEKTADFLGAARLADKRANMSKETATFSMDPIKVLLLGSRSPEETKKPASSARRSSRVQKPAKCKVISDARLDPEKAEALGYRLTEDEINVRRSLLAATNKKVKEKKEAAEEGKKGEKKDKKEEKSSNDQEDEEEKSEECEGMETNNDLQGSITSSTTSSTHSFYSLRAAIDEKYVPNSIKNMDLAAKGVFFTVLALAITYFTVELVLHSSIKNTINAIGISEGRMRNLVSITLHSLNLMIIAADSFLEDPNEVTSVWFEEIKDKLRVEVTSLKLTQAELSVNSRGLSEDALRKINPGNMTLFTIDIPGLPNVYSFTMWQSAMELVSAGFQLANSEVAQIDEATTPAAYFVSRNALNNVYVSMEPSTRVIMEEVEDKRKWIVMLFLVIFIVASVILLLATILLIPVVSKVNKNKQEVLELFMHIKKANANDELTKCRKFLGTFQSVPETEILAGEGEEDSQDEVDPEVSQNKFKEVHKTKDYGVSIRKFKKLKLNLGLVLFKFIFLIVIMEGYFILTYLLSKSFLDQTVSLAAEFYMLIKRYPMNTLLLLMEKYPLPHTIE